MTLGVYLGEILPRMPIPQGAVYQTGVQLARIDEFFYRY